MKELFIIRHGETDFNRQGIVQGSGVNPPLNDIGRKQAEQFFNYYRKEPFEIIYTSTLQRSHQSVQGFIDLGIPWEQHPELNELCWGDQEGKKVTLESRHLLHELLKKWNEGLLNEKLINGQSPVELQQEQLRFIDYLNSHPYKKILICMHGRAMRIFISTLLNKDLSLMDEFPHHNLTLYRLMEDGDHYTIVDFNDMKHLHV